MGNHKKILLTGRKTWAGHLEYTAGQLPAGECENFYHAPVDRPTAERLFNLGQAVYVRGLRVVKQ